MFKHIMIPMYKWMQIMKFPTSFIEQYNNACLDTFGTYKTFSDDVIKLLHERAHYRIKNRLYPDSSGHQKTQSTENKTHI
jgi:hypothetical protein